MLKWAILVMSISATIWLSYEFWRLIWQSGEMGAIDLRQRHSEMQAWFTAKPVYGEIVTAVYPPASYVILWPLMGWLTVTAARWFWAATAIIALIWTAFLCVRESGACTPLQRAFVGLMPLSMYATGATIGNGQLLVHILPGLMAGLLLLKRRETSWRNDLLVAALMLMALVKPTVSAPFFWIVLFVPGRLRPAMIVSIGYGLLSVLAALFQKTGIFTLLSKWTDRAAVGVEWGTARGGVANQHSWLETIKLEGLEGTSSLIALMILGFWIYRNRRTDIWILMSVTAVVARFWTYHMWYDDLLILLPMVALFRIANQHTPVAAADWLAGPLLAITMLSLIAPGGLYLFPMPWNTLYVVLQTITWVAVLIFLINHARIDRKALLLR